MLSILWDSTIPPLSSGPLFPHRSDLVPSSKVFRLFTRFPLLFFGLYSPKAQSFLISPLTGSLIFFLLAVEVFHRVQCLPPVPPLERVFLRLMTFFYRHFLESSGQFFPSDGGLSPIIDFV